MFGFIKKLKEDKSGATKTRKGKGYYLEVDESQVAQALKGNQPAKTESEAKPESAAVEAAAPTTTEAEAPAKTEAETPKAEPVKAAVPVVAATKKEAPAVTTFAPNYLLTLSSTDGRRRPGANMKSFLEMARKVKTPK